MPRPASKTLTESEERIMRVLWSQKEASVKEICEALPEEQASAYNTVSVFKNLGTAERLI